MWPLPRVTHKAKDYEVGCSSPAQPSHIMEDQVGANLNIVIQDNQSLGVALTLRRILSTAPHLLFPSQGSWTFSSPWSKICCQKFLTIPSLFNSMILTSTRPPLIGVNCP